MPRSSIRGVLGAVLLSSSTCLSACDSAESSFDGAAAAAAGAGGTAGTTGAAGTAGSSGTAGTGSGVGGTGTGGTGESGSGGATAGAAGRGGTSGGSAGAGGAGAAGAGGAGVGTGGSMGGESQSGGAGGSGGTSGGSGSDGGPFTLAWQDDFDSIDSSRWALQTFSWDGNLAQFSTANASVKSGILSIALTPEPNDTAKPYRGVELRSIPTLTYGKVETRMRFAKGSGVVSSLVLIYTPWPADNWNEIDIEHLGKTPDSSQLNCQVYTGAPTTPPVTTSVTPTQDPEIKALDFDAEADFHVYSIEWTPSDVRFSADGTLLRTWTTEIARMTLPQNILFTIWASNVADWAGPITEMSAPTTAEVDWVKVYSFDG